MSRPKLFIGSSVEGLEVAYSIQENLKYVAETTVWDQGVFNLSESSLESLITVLESSDYGVFVFSPDDHVKIRGKKDLAVRDNVLFELGLFVGKLGRKRSFIVIPDNKEFHLPTDLIGMAPAKYEADRADKNLQAGTGSACHKIRDMVVKQGSFTTVNEAPETLKNNNVNVDSKKDDWANYILIDKNYDKAIDLLKKKVRYSKNDDKIYYKGWICYSEFQKDPIRGNEEYEKFINENQKSNLAYIAYADNLIWSNSFKKALEVIENGLKNCEKKVTLTNLKAQCYWSLNQKEEAIKILSDQLLILQDETIFISLADYYVELEDKKNATLIIQKAYFIFPNSEAIMKKLATLAYDINQKEVCVFIYKELLKIKPNSPNYWCLLGNAYLDLQLDNSALYSYEKAAELSNSNQSWILSNIGNLYNNKGLYIKAEEILKEAVMSDEESEYIHSRLSSVYTSKQEESKKIAQIIALAKTKLNLDLI